MQVENNELVLDTGLSAAEQTADTGASAACQAQPTPEQTIAVNGLDTAADVSIYSYLPKIYIPTQISEYLPTELPIYRSLQVALQQVSIYIAHYAPGIHSVINSSPSTGARRAGERLIFNQILKHVNDASIKSQLEMIFTEIQYNGLDRELPYYVSHETYKPVIRKVLSASLYTTTKNTGRWISECMTIALMGHLTNKVLNLSKEENSNYIYHTALLGMVLLYAFFSKMIFTSPIKAYIDDQAAQTLKASINSFENTALFQGYMHRVAKSGKLQQLLQLLIDIALKSCEETDVSDKIYSVLDTDQATWSVDGNDELKTVKQIRFEYHNAIYLKSYAERVAQEADEMLSKTFVGMRPFAPDSREAIIFNALIVYARSDLSRRLKEYMLTEGYTAVNAELKIKNAKCLEEKASTALINQNPELLNTELAGFKLEGFLDLKERFQISTLVLFKRKRIEHQMLDSLAALPYRDMLDTCYEVARSKVSATKALIFRQQPVVTPLIEEYIPRIPIIDTSTQSTVTARLG